MFSRRARRPLVRTLLACAAAACALVASAATSPLTDFSANLRLAAGHKHNVLLSAVDAQDSRLALFDGEVFFVHTASDQLDLLGFANATFTRFVDSAENPHELQAYAHAEAAWLPSPRLKLTPAVEAYHLKQVFDLSVNNVDRRTALLSVNGALASLATRFELPAALWLELKPAAQRERFRDHSDDHVQHLGRLTLGRTFLERRFELSVSGQALRRTYDTRPRYTTAGRPLSGTELIFEQREAEVRAKLAWGERHRCTTSTAFTVASNRDNGSGFFNYHHRALRQEFTWQHADWEARLVARAGRYDYDVQTQGIGINPPFRLKEEFLVESRLTYAATARVSLYATYVWERSRSNDPLARYRAQTAFAGIDFSL